MIIHYEGADYPFDYDDIGVQQGIAIERHTGLPFAEWGSILEKGGSLIALQALGWLILDGGDLGKPIAETNFKMGKLGTALTTAIAAAQAEEAAKAAQPGPTSGVPPGGATGAAQGNGAAGGPLSVVSSAMT